jgi:hypothetical protein
MPPYLDTTDQGCPLTQTQMTHLVFLLDLMMKKKNYELIKAR